MWGWVVVGQLFGVLMLVYRNAAVTDKANAEQMSEAKSKSTLLPMKA